MRRSLTFCLIVPFIAGCAVFSKGPGVPPSVDSQRTEASDQAIAVEPEALPLPVPPKKPKDGFIVGKTDFKGLLKTAYVRLLIVDRDNPANRYYFYVGSKGNQSVVPWGEGKVIEPGYFIMQLPAGSYKVTGIAIPVGSTIAEEGMELDFDVAAGKAFYVGTLDIDGTQEKVKFGGVPLVRPGFVYKLSVIDAFAEADVEARTLLPDAKMPLVRNIFTVVSAMGDDIPSSDLIWPDGKK